MTQRQLNWIPVQPNRGQIVLKDGYISFAVLDNHDHR